MVLLLININYSTEICGICQSFVPLEMIVDKLIHFLPVCICQCCTMTELCGDAAAVADHGGLPDAPVSVSEFTNKFVLELNRKRTRAATSSLAELIVSVAPLDSPVRSAPLDVVDASFTYLHGRRDELRRKKKKKDIADLEQQNFQINDVALAVAPAGNCSSAQAQRQPETKERNLLDYEISKKEKHLQSLVMSVEEKKKKLKHLGHYSKPNVDKRDDRSHQTQSQLRKTKNLLKKTGQERDAAASTVATQSQELESLHETVQDLQQQLQQTNMQVSNNI